MVTPTSLPTGIVAGNTGHIAWGNTVGAAVNDLTNATTGLDSKRPKGTTIRPDDFTGTDHAKLQAAVDYCIANLYPTIILDRMLDLTGAAAVLVTKTPWSDRRAVTFEGTGGGIEKNDAGVVFTSATENTGDLTFRNVKYISTAGAGAILLDCDKLLRIMSSGGEYRNWDIVAQQLTVGRWAQSMRFEHEKILGGAGPAFYLRESIDCTFDDILCEDRLTGSAGGFFANSDGAMTTIANRELRITNTCIENCSGIPIRLAMCWTTMIQGCYFEYNGVATDPQIDLYTLATLTRQASVLVSENMLHRTPAQKAANTASILAGPGASADLVVSQGNIQDGGILWKFGNATGKVFGSGDAVDGAGGLIVYPGQENQYFTPGGKSTTTALRPKNPRVDLDVYFDTTLDKLIVASTAGTKAVVTLIISAGASSSGNITLTIASVAYATIAVTAGDTITQVRDKIAAAAATFFPTWKLTPSSTNTVTFNAFLPSLVSGSNSLAAGGTGVTQSYFGLDVPGTNPTWTEHLTGLTGTATVDFASIAAGAVGESSGITVTGAAVGDKVTVGPPSTVEAGLGGWCGYVSATNTVKIRVGNLTGSAIDPASATWTIAIVR